MTGWRGLGRCALAALASAAAIAGCGGTRQDAHEPKGNFAIAIPVASFPAHQHLAQHSTLTISVRNAGDKRIPDIAVTVEAAGEGTAAAAFSEVDNQPGLANSSRPVWIVDVAPGGGATGGPGGAVTAYANTWALGTLAPGQTKSFVWHVTAVKPGVHRIVYRIAAGLNGKAKAVLAGGGIPQGSFTVKIDGQPQEAVVNDAGQVVQKPAPPK